MGIKINRGKALDEQGWPKALPNSTKLRILLYFVQKSDIGR